MSDESAQHEPKKAAKVRFTTKTRRGLFLVHELVRMSLDDNLAPNTTIMRRWHKDSVSDYENAMAWIEQEELQ